MLIPARQGRPERLPGFHFQGLPLPGASVLVMAMCCRERMQDARRRRQGVTSMTDDTSNPARHFGREVRRARLAAKMTLAEFGRAAGYHPGQISRIERGVRPPTETFAQMCDKVFPERDGWFDRFYQESRQWAATPPWFRNWIEHEQRALTLQVWQPSSLSEGGS